MPLSQNGFSAGDRTKIAAYSVPGNNAVKLPLRKGDVATVLLYVAKRFNAEVESLHPGWCWGYAYRNVRGSTASLSNHSSGTAMDLNAPAHPLHTAPSANYSAAQIDAIHKIVKACGGVVRWGGDYTGRKDGMHFEIVGTPGEVALLATKIRTHFQVAIRRVLKKGSKGADVKAVQKRLITLGFLPAGSADGDFGPKTYAAVKAFKKTRKWLHVLHNGEVGKGTVKLLGGSLQWKG